VASGADKPFGFPNFISVLHKTPCLEVADVDAGDGFLLSLDPDQGGAVGRQYSVVKEDEFLHEPSLGSRNSAYVAGNLKAKPPH
jgi:hypothetical protein